MKYNHFQYKITISSVKIKDKQRKYALRWLE